MSRLVSIVSRDEHTWRRSAACRGKDPSTFFEPNLEPIAARICAACPVRDECLEEAIADRRDGYWGGTTERERQNIVDRRRWPNVPRPRKTAAPRGELYEKLVALLGHPGRWAKIDSYPSPNSAGAVASLIRNGHRPAPPGRWSIEARITDDRGSDLYARYDGPDLVLVPATEGASG